MSTTLARSPWATAFHTPLQEFGLTPLTVLSGQIPAELQGSLYRNGPALFERGGDLISHWFDGDGAVLGVHFADGQASGVYRFVQTAGLQAEEQSQSLTLGGYGRKASGPFWQTKTKNAANTSVVTVADRLLALWEGGHPHALDLKTLATIGLDNLGELNEKQTFSAHPKRCPQTSDLFNFGVTMGRKTQLHLYRCDRNGHLKQQQAIPLAGIPMIHDFVMAGPYLIFCISPVYLNPLPMLLQQQSYSDALRWQPQQGTTLLVIDRDTLEPVAQQPAEPWFQWHYGNGYVDRSGQVIIDVVRYPDFQINQFLQEVPSGQPVTVAPGALWRLSIQPQTATLLHAEPLSDRPCEFPTVSPLAVGQPHRQTYCVARSDGATATDMFDAIASFDHQSGQHQLLTVGEGCYPSEPLIAPHPDHAGWLLSVVYNGNNHTSEVWIINPQQIEAGPICRLALPEPVAFSFHGTWAGR